MAKYQCVQFGLCPRADGKVIEDKPGEPFTCPLGDTKCRENLEPISGGKSMPKPLLIGALAILVVGGLGVWYFMTGSSKSNRSDLEAQLVEVWPWLK
ncbi:MAG: hypothetical protein WCK17_01080 [Verrucomicrobiota bacterium]